VIQSLLEVAQDSEEVLKELSLRFFAWNWEVRHGISAKKRALILALTRQKTPVSNQANQVMGSIFMEIDDRDSRRPPMRLGN